MTRWPSPGSSIEVHNAAGKATYRNSFVTDLDVNPDTVVELAACGRARWKIENERFNVLKTNGYNLEHNFGHGKEHLSTVLAVLNLLAFGFHTAAMLAVLAWRQAVSARGADIPVLRAPANHHRLRHIPGLGSSAPLHHRRRNTTTLTPAAQPVTPSPHHPHRDRQRKLHSPINLELLATGTNSSPCLPHPGGRGLSGGGW